MFHYMFRPLDEHIDGGLGAIGDAFLQAARALDKTTKKNRFFHQELPSSYLHRHAIELFLKSAIVIVHRALSIDFGPNPPRGEPLVRVKAEWKPFTKVHSVLDLWAYVFHLLRSTPKLKESGQTDWSKVPEGLERDLMVIESVDPGSTYFRYPNFKNPAIDKAKSDWKAAKVEKVIEELTPGSPPLKAFLLLDTEDRISAAFVLDSGAERKINSALRRASGILSGVPTGLRMEIAGGR